VFSGVSSAIHLVRDVRKGSNQPRSALVESSSLRLPLFEVGWNLCVPAEVMNVLKLTLWRFDWLAKKLESFNRLIESLATFFKTILDENLGVSTASTVIEFRTVD